MATSTNELPMTKPKYTLKSVKARVQDVIESHSEDVRRNSPMRFGAGCWAEFAWFIKQYEKKCGKIELDPEPEEDEDDAEEAAE